MKAYYFLIGLALIAGALLPVQGGLNAKMGEAVEDPIYGALISFIIGAIGMVIYVFLAKVNLSAISQVSSVHWTVWTGGLMGAFYVVATIILVPKIGVTMTFGLTVAGQMGLSLVLDHYGFMGYPIQTINWQRVAGILLIIGGVLLIRNF